MIVIILTIEEMTEETIVEIDEMIGKTIREMMEDMMIETPGMIETQGLTRDGIPGTQGINLLDLRLLPNLDSQDMIAETGDLMISLDLNNLHTELQDSTLNTPINNNILQHSNILTKLLNTHHTEIQLA
jgi:hypothetical protein